VFCLSHPKVSNGAIRVLHVDDDPSVQEITKLMLLDLNGGFVIDQACCVDEAFKKLAGCNYDVVVSDYEMPQKDGLQFLKQLREQNNQIPFILFTGKGREEVAIKALNLGADGYINKQGNPETVYGELTHTINKIVQHRKAKKELQQRDILLAEFASQTPGMLFQFKRRPDGTYCMPYTAEAIRDIFGCSPQDVLEDFSPIAKAIIPEDLEKVVHSIEYSAQNMTPWQFEYRVQLPGQQKRWLWGQSIPTKLSDGTIIWNGYNADITERKQTEEMLKQSMAKFRDFAESLPEIVFEIDGKGALIFVNQRAYQSTGYRADEFGDNFSFIRLVTPADQEKAAANIKKIMSGEIVGSNEYNLVKKDGSVFPVMIWSNPIIVQNKVAGLRGIIVDISERKKAERLLKESQEQLKAIIMNAPIGIATTASNFYFLSANEAFCRIVGYSEDELQKRSFRDITYPDDVEVSNKYMQELSCGNIPYFSQEKRYVRKDGNIIEGKVTVSVIRNNKSKPVLFVAELEDITERKKAEETLRQERDMLESLTKNIGAGLVMISKDYKILWMNNYLRQFGDASENDPCYSSFNTCTTICPDCGPKKIFEGADFDRREYCNQMGISKDHPVWFELTATPIKDKEGNVVAALELSVNITEKKDAEKKQRESGERIEMMNEKLHVVGSLTRHDVGNKLMAAKSNLYLLKKRIGDNADLAKYLEGIDSALVSSDKIFEFSRLYERIGVEKPSKENVFENFNQAVALMPDLGDVEVVNESKELVVVADSLLKQLFYNFIDNSVKHGEKVTQIRLYYAEDNNGVTLVYEDNGVGVSEANKPKLFDAGFTTGKGSSGFGLYLVKRMMDVYGWSITEEGTPGKGAKFVLTIPKLNSNGKENYQTHQ
jgi:PAS domain S-box-containing protein